MATVALEINPNRILLTAWKGAGSKVTHAIEIPFESGSNDASIAELLKKAVESNGLARAEAIVVISRSESELRELDLPPAPDDELPDMVRFKAKSDFASFNDRWLLDYVVLNEDPGIPRRVLAAAIAPAVSDRIRSIIEPTGLKLKQLVLRPLAIMSLFARNEASETIRLVVNPGDLFTDIIVAKGSQPISTRSVRIAPDLGNDKRNDLLVSEVRRTLASTKRQLDGTAITEVVLLANEKENKHLIGNLTQRLQIDVQPVDPFSLLSVDPPKSFRADPDAQNPWQFTPLLGSLNGQSNDIGARIDFLNPSRRIEKTVDRSRHYLYGGLAGLAALLTIGFGWWTLSSQASEIAMLTDQYREATKVNEPDGVRPGVDTILARTGKIDQWKKRSVHWLDELDAMSKRFLTADEAIVESLDAFNRTETPAMNLRSKVVSNKEESNLTSALGTRPYVVTPERTEVSGDPDYPLTFIGNIALEQKGTAWLKEIDDHAREFNSRKPGSIDASQELEAN
jgi:Tfp pilus assembly PilM family ATPase